MEADMSTTSAAFEGRAGRYTEDNTLLVKFFSHSKPNATKSAEEGRPIFVDTDYIQIMQPGNKDSIVIRPATEMDRARFPDHYRKYKARVDQVPTDGTPLAEWPQITRSQAEELRFQNVLTVEQLAGMSDANAQGVMGINSLKQKARDFLEGHDKSAELIEKLTARIDELEANQKKKPGRKPKEE
jgi:hypothetical protein